MLEKERQYFAAHEADWLKAHRGRFVVIKDDTLVGIYETLDEALAAGGHQFGLKPFLVRRLGEPTEEIRIPALTLGLLRADSQRPV